MAHGFPLSTRLTLLLGLILLGTACAGPGGSRPKTEQQPPARTGPKTLTIAVASTTTRTANEVLPERSSTIEGRDRNHRKNVRCDDLE